MLSPRIGSPSAAMRSVALLPLAMSLIVLLITLAPSASPTAPAGTSTVITYTASTDGATLDYLEYLPTGYNPNVAYPLAILLHGAGGNIYQYDTTEWHTAADTHGYILALAHARTLPGYGTSRLSFFMNGSLVPAEQDVLDILPHLAARRLINPNRVYLGGYSMGGVGTLNIATLNPGVFAAAASGTTMSDLFQQWDYSPAAGFDILFGGPYSQTATIKTYYTQNSPRFLIANLMHTPIRVVHGLSDTLIPNDTSTWAYMESRHIIDTPGFSDSRGMAVTLSQLAAQWPGSFYEEHLWPPLSHGAGVLSWTAESVLTFFDAHLLITNPLTIAFTTYEDKHTQAYWLQMNLTQPWTAIPGQVYAIRVPALNTVELQVTGSMTLTLDIAPMGLTSATPLTVEVIPLNGTGPAGDLAVVLSGTWSVGHVWSVIKDGAALPSTAYAVQATRLTVLRQTTDVAHTYVIDSALPFTPTAWLYLPLIAR